MHLKPRTRVLVTGANGFIGSHLCKKLLELGCEVTASVREQSRRERFEILGIQNSLQALNYSLSELSSAERLIREAKPDCIFHLAAPGVRTSHAVDYSMFDSHLRSTFSLLQAAHSQLPGCRVVIMGSGFEYAPNDNLNTESSPLNPFTFYGTTKAAAWQLARFFAKPPIDLTCARLFTTYGPLEHVSRIYPLVMCKASRGEKLELSSGRQLRDYLYIDDVISALPLIAEAAQLNSQVVNVCSSEPKTIREIIETILRAVARRKNIDFSDLAALCEFGVKQDRAGEPMFLAGNNQRLRELGWAPKVSLESGVTQTLRWYLDNEHSWEKLS